MTGIPSITSDGKYGYWGELDHKLASRVTSGQTDGNYIVYKHKDNYYVASAGSEKIKIVRYESRWTFEKIAWDLKRGADEEKIQTMTSSTVMKMVSSWACGEWLNNAIIYDPEDLKRFMGIRGKSVRVTCEKVTK